MYCVTREPLDSFAMGESIDCGGVRARINRTTHQCHRQRSGGIVILFHEAYCRKYWNSRLAYCDHMRVGAEVMQHGDHVVYIVIEAEYPRGKRQKPSINPIGDVYIVIWQKAFNRPTQQRRVMAGHRRN